MIPGSLSANETDEIALIRLKHPFGKLLTGPPVRTNRILKDFIKRTKPLRIFAIGDIVASNMMKSKIKVDSIVIDFKSERTPITPIKLNSFKVINVKNNAGTITPEACHAMREAVQGSSATAIIVDGEEDLLTLSAIKFAHIGSLIVYGQPHVGIVLVQVTERTKLEAEQLLEFVKKKLSIKG